MKRRALIVTALAAPLTLALPAASADTPSWQHVPAPGQVRPQAGLNETVASGPRRAWAVGTDAVGRSAPGYPLVLRWDGTAWQRQSLPGIRWQGELLSVAAPAPTEVWAVGRDSAGATRLLRSNGTTWSESRAPSGFVLTKAVAGAGRTWLIGTRDQAPAMLRRDGRGWQELPAPPGSVYGMHVLADDDVWAAGASELGATASHWDGRAWQQTIVSGSPRAVVGSILAVSPTEVWAGGSGGFIGGPPGKPIPPLLARWDGQTWERVAVPTNFGGITSLTPGPSGELAWVAVARSLKWAPPGSNPPLVPGPDFLARNGQSFAEYDEPQVPGEGDSYSLQLAAVPGTSMVWAVGRAGGPDGTFAPRILRFG
ncbi:hypothetical protein ACFYVL_31320 [Streptomyces sp. NPDC004111]|uniref:hypothetical protein n=1 Tax=Streptomyces sp. NPDC004111 TaxID=3364690 RepID=UPI003687D749